MNGRTCTRCRTRFPKFAKLEKATMNIVAYARARARYGWRRILLNAAKPHGIRTSTKISRNEFSKLDTKDVKLCASKGSGRNRTVSTALGACVGDWSIDGAKEEPPSEDLA